MKLLNLLNGKGRNAQISYTPVSIRPTLHYKTSDHRNVRSLRVVKFTRTLNDLVREKDLASLAEEMIDADPEIDFEVAGRITSKASRLYVNSENQFVFAIQKKEIIYTHDGERKEEREPRYLPCNVNEDSPLTGAKLFLKKDIYNKFIFSKKYQLKHINSLTYDFLYDLAKELDEKQSIMLLGAGAKGTEPLLFENGGKPYRGFLEGRIRGDQYLLILHLSNMELKTV